MKYFIDTEFLERAPCIYPISVGIVAEDGREFYGINRDAPWSFIAEHNWLPHNVMPGIPYSEQSPIGIDLEHPDMMTERELAAGLAAITAGDDNPRFWAYNASYHWVVVCQLFGGMMLTPKYWPTYVLDLEQEWQASGCPAETPPHYETFGNHHALLGARWVRDAHAVL